MKSGRGSTRKNGTVEAGSANVYADLGYADSEGMLLKAQLVTKIAQILRERRMTQAQAAKLLHLTQPKVSDMLRGNFQGMSERRLLRCLTRLGRDVRIVVTRGTRPQGRMSVRFE